MNATFNWLFLGSLYVFAYYLSGKSSTMCHVATMGIFISSLFGPNDNESVAESLTTYTWFSWAKRISVIIAWIAYFLLLKTNNNECVLNLTQYTIFVNCIEVALVCFADGEFIGLFVLAMSFFTVRIYEEDGRYKTSDDAPLICCCCCPCIDGFYISSRWWFRLYYVTIGLWNSFGYYFNKKREMSIMSSFMAFVPFILAEIHYEENQTRFFMMRAFIIIWSVIIDTLVFPRFMFFPNDIIVDSGAVKLLQDDTNMGLFLRNGLQLCSLAIIICVLCMRDKSREHAMENRYLEHNHVTAEYLEPSDMQPNDVEPYVRRIHL